MEGALEARNQAPLLVFLLPPQKTPYKHRHVQQKQKAFRKNPLGDPIHHLCRLEAPVNDKAMRSITGLVPHWHRAPCQHIIPHRNILQVPCLRQERGVTTSCVPCHGSVWGRLSWLRKQRSVQGS